MKSAALTVAVLAASFTLAAAQSADTDPAMSYYKIDVMRPLTPVYVVNFPEVQAVTGSVSVDNLPAVQTVGGTINVGNLPFDADGAVRVTSAPARQPVVFELLDTPGEHVQDYVLPLTVDTTGYSTVGLAVATSTPGADVVYNLNWNWGEGDSYGQVLDYRVALQGGNLCYAGHLASGRQKLHCPVVSGRAQVVVSASAGVVFTSVKLYLFP